MPGFKYIKVGDLRGEDAIVSKRNGSALTIEIPLEHALWQTLSNKSASQEIEVTLVATSDPYAIKDKVFPQAGEEYYHPERKGDSICPSVKVVTQMTYVGLFVDANDKKLMRIIKYGDVAKIHLNILKGKDDSFDDYRFYLTMIENRIGQDRDTYIAQKQINPDQSGMVVEGIDTTQLFEESHLADCLKEMNPRYLYYILEREKIKDETGQGKKMVYVYPESYIDLSEF